MTDLRILFVDDDPVVSPMVKEFLEAKGYAVDWRNNGEAGLLAFVEKGPFQLCVLDVQMPFKNGFDLAQEIRAQNAEVPIVFLTANAGKDDKMTGFGIGADDYVTKPFSLDELYMRIQAIMRRYARQQAAVTIQQETFQIGAFHFDSGARLLSHHVEGDVRLSAKEAGLLHQLCLYPGQVVKRSHILMAVWGDDDYFKNMSMNVYVTKLRKLLHADPRIEIINIHGEGYKLIVSV